MAATLASVCSVPLTSVLLLFELTKDYGILLPFMVNAQLASLDIDIDAQAKGFMPGRFRALEDYWNESQSIRKPAGHSADGWVAEYGQYRLQHGEPEAWAHSRLN